MEVVMVEILAILQARMSSTRLPGKVLKPILGRPMLALQIERVLQSKKIDKLVVATSVDPTDDSIEALCRELSIPCFRGSLDDVLDRFYKAALNFQPKHIVRLTGDCPLIDPDILDELITFYLKGNYDYASNSREPTFPDGLDAEIFKFDVLEKAWKEAKLPSQREHVTSFIYQHPERFSLGIYKNAVDLSFHRWTVDYEEDFEFVSKIFEELYPKNPRFRMADILKFLELHPELVEINKKFKRNEGFERSLQLDKIYMSAEKFNLHKSLSLQERAKKRIPGMSQLLSKSPYMFSYGVWPGYFSKAKGCEVWDLDGNRYIDMSISGIGANILGYADPDVDEAVKKAIDRGISSSLNCPEEVELADLLCEIHPWAEMVRFARTGGEAMTVAIRIARAYTGREKVAFCGYHGWHDWYLSANIGTEDALGEHLLPGLNPIGVPKALKGTAFPFRYNRLDELQKILENNKNEIAAIIMEPIRNMEPEPGFLEGVRKLADEAGAVLIIDEISSGFRMNTGGAHLILGIEPDIAVFSKALGNGYAISAIIGKSDIMKACVKTFISSTNWTERIGFVAAIATIEKHRKYDVGRYLIKIGEMIQKGWKDLSEKHQVPIDISGIPPLSHFTFKHEKHLVLKALFIQHMLERGFLASNIFYSMFAHKEEHVIQYLKAADEVFKLLKEAIDSDNPEKYLLGEPSSAGFGRLN